MAFNNDIKFRWETDEEFVYRKKIAFVANNVSIILKSMDEVRKKDNNYVPLRDKIKVNFEIINGINIPECYKKTHQYLTEGYKYYCDAFDIIVNIFKSIGLNEKKKIGLLNKCATFIEVGNSFTTIVSCKNFELFEKQQAEYNKMIKQ